MYGKQKERLPQTVVGKHRLVIIIKFPRLELQHGKERAFRKCHALAFAPPLHQFILIPPRALHSEKAKGAPLGKGCIKSFL